MRCSGGLDTLRGELRLRWTLRRVLANEPERLAEWLAYSEDKRVDTGRYLRRSEGVLVFAQLAGILRRILGCVVSVVSEFLYGNFGVVVDTRFLRDRLHGCHRVRRAQ
jgi:hypothetical protein